MADRNPMARSFASPSLELPRRARPQLARGQSNTAEQDSPHIHINSSDITYKTGSQSDMSVCSRADSPMDEMTRQFLSPPDLRYNSCFDEFRIPPFSTMTTLPDNLNDSDLRDVSSTGMASRLPQRLLRTRHRRNVHSLGGPGDDSQPLITASQMKTPHHRTRNRALSSAQFDDILNEVFYR